jgi:hypothetical protein
MKGMKGDEGDIPIMRPAFAVPWPVTQPPARLSPSSPSSAFKKNT